jgi:hypothetical protein
MAEELPVHPLTGLTALGVLPSGRIVWPVLGAASDEGDGAEGDGGAEDDDDAGDGQDGDGQDGDGLGAKGKEALAKERKARRDADKARKAAEAERDTLKAAAAKSDGDAAQADAEKIRRDAEKTATDKANKRILSAELKAAAAGKLANPELATKLIDLAQFEVGDDGEFDGDEMSEAISDLVKKYPNLAARAQGFQGAGDGGARTGGSRPRQLAAADLKTMSPQAIVKARAEGRLERYMNGD